MPTTTTVWVATTSRERQLIRELNESNQDVEHLRHELMRAKARIKQLEESLRGAGHYRVDLTPPPPERGHILRIGEPGYITRIVTTPKGKQLIANPEVGGITNLDVYILVLGAQTETGCTFEQLKTYIPKAVGDKDKIKRFTSALNARGLIQVDFEKEPFNGTP